MLIYKGTLITRILITTLTTISGIMHNKYNVYTSSYCIVCKHASLVTQHRVFNFTLTVLIFKNQDQLDAQSLLKTLIAVLH
jgi:hypothetical protein